MRVQAVVSLVPLGHPRVGERLTTRPCPQLSEERCEVVTDQRRVVIPAATIGEGAKAIQDIRRAVPPQPSTRTTSSLGSGALGISRLPASNVLRFAPQRSAERPAALTCSGNESE